jgi:hypothetical protein
VDNKKITEKFANIATFPREFEIAKANIARICIYFFKVSRFAACVAIIIRTKRNKKWIESNCSFAHAAVMNQTSLHQKNKVCRHPHLAPSQK